MRLPFACRTLNSHKVKNLSLHTADALCKNHNTAKRDYDILMELNAQRHKMQKQRQDKI